jgi:ketosteroid isomerase-like protein
VIALGDDVVLEATLGGVDRTGGEPWLTHWCAVLTFSGGLIVRDDTYVDLTRWPAGAALVAKLAAAPAAGAGR